MSDPHGDTSKKSLLQLTPSGWAWEWLRRNRDYIRESERSRLSLRHQIRAEPFLEVIEPEVLCDARWGICFSESHLRPYGEAAVFWHPQRDPRIMSVAAIPAKENSQSIDLCDLDAPVRVLKGLDAEQVLISSGLQSIQLHVIEGTVLRGPVTLAHVVTGPVSSHVRLSQLDGLATLLNQKKFPSNLFTASSYASRWILALTAIELERAGVSHPDIATELYKGTKELNFATDWRRSRLRRLLNTGNALIDGGYLKILARTGK